MVTGERSFSPTKDQISLLSEGLGLSEGNVEFLFIGLAMLYRHANSGENSKLPYDEVLLITLQELADLANWDEDVKQIIYQRLYSLLQRSESHRAFRKVERLKAGFQPHATGFSSLVELRPRYVDNEAGSLTVDGYVPVIQFRITTDTSEGKNHVFQLTQGAFEEFKKSIDRLHEKIIALKQQDGSTIKIIDL